MLQPKQYKVLLFLIIVCIISRLPQLLGHELLLDGDECVVAVMAKHILAHKDFPLYFYGQAYGFSLVECLFIIPFYWVLGITTVAVKLGMLSLWTIGVVFLYKTFVLINKSHKWLPLLFILIFICSPAWAIWSIKARGGYLTSFTLTSILFYILFLDKKSYAVYIWSGVLCAVIYQSQPLWLPCIAPFLAYFLFKDRKAARVLLFLLPALALSVAAYFYRQRLSNFGIIQLDFTTNGLGERITRIPRFLYYSLHGNYYFDERQSPNFFCAFFAILFSAIIAALPCIAIYNVITGKRGVRLFNLSALGILPILAYTMLSMGFQCRYLLPITGYTLICLLLWINTVTIRKRFLYTASIFFIVPGIIAVITFYNFAFSALREKSLRDTLGFITQTGAHYSYCYDNMFTWQVIFYSNEQVLCHEQRMPGRYPEYARKVDSAFYNGGTVVYISPPIPLPKIDFPKDTTVNGYTIVINPPKDVIEKNFQRIAVGL